MNDLARQFEILGRKQLAFEDGLEILKRARTDLRASVIAGNSWGLAAIISSVVLVPANVIVNGCDLKAANTVYVHTVKALYNHYAASGSRLDGPAKKPLKLLKEALKHELVTKGFKQFVPGVSILVGLAEDSLAAFQVIGTVDRGSQEFQVRVQELDRTIHKAEVQLRAIGRERAEMFEQSQRFSNIA